MPKQGNLSLMMCRNALVFSGYILNRRPDEARLFCPRFKTGMIGAGGTVHSVKLLTYNKHRDLWSSCSTRANDSSVVTCVLNLRTGGE